jgi:hypothetical protein
MARFRKIDVRMWVDAEFQNLTAPEPNAQTLWIYLLTNPETGNIPGLYRAGEMGMAEALRWPVEGFRERFRELSEKGMTKADWSARVIWIPNAIRYNAPENPNVVRSWRIHWEEIPECSLKIVAYQRLKGFVETLGEGFAKGFRESCPKPYDRRSPQRSPKGLANQEQEQEQEQKQEQEGDSSATRPAEPRPPLEIATPENGNGASAKDSPQELTPVQQAVRGWKVISGFELEDREWDRLYFKRTAASVKRLIDFLGSWEAAVDCIEDVYKRFTEKGLTVTVETVVKHAADWKKDRQELEARV